MMPLNLLLMYFVLTGLSWAPAGHQMQEEPATFVWLMQGKEEMDLSFLRSEASDAIQVVWGKEPSEQSTDAFFLPNSTCTEGRNHLLQQALMLESTLGKPFTYMIYTEDDSELEEINDFGDNAGNPYRTFEKYLDKRRPAVAFPFYGYGTPKSSPLDLDPSPQDVSLECFWDHNTVAFHRDVVPSLLPYWTGMDNESWWFSQRIVTVLASAFFHTERMRINAVSVANTEHRWNPEMADVDMMIPDSWLIPALSQNRLHIEHAMCAFDNDRAVPRGLPERHRPGKELVMDECHPLTRSMREFWRKMPSGDRRLSRTHDLVGASGMLTCESFGSSSHGTEPMHAMGSGEISSAMVSETSRGIDGRAKLKNAAQEIIQGAMAGRPDQLTIVSKKYTRFPSLDRSRGLGIRIDMDVKISRAEESEYSLYLFGEERSVQGVPLADDILGRMSLPFSGSSRNSDGDRSIKIHFHIHNSNAKFASRTLRLELYRKDGSKASVFYSKLQAEDQEIAAAA